MFVPFLGNFLNLACLNFRQMKRCIYTLVVVFFKNPSESGLNTIIFCQLGTMKMEIIPKILFSGKMKSVSRIAVVNASC